MHKNIVCLVIDRLRASAVGAHGAAWCDTPALNRLAAESFVFDFAMIDRPQLDTLYRGLWQGMHAAGSAERSLQLPSLPEALRRQGFRTALLTDDDVIAEHPLAGGFEDQVRLESRVSDEPATSIEETSLGRFFAAALGCLDEIEPSGSNLLWLHSRGMGAPWDAPLQFRNSLADEEDPEPPTTVEPPDRMLARDYDPDDLLGQTYAYTGQIMLLDQCLEALLRHFEESGLAENTLLILLGARGFPLGEHLRLGPVDEPLYEETVHVPFMLRFPDRLGALARSPALVQAADLPATIAAWLELEESFVQPGGGRNLLPVIQQDAAAVRDRLCMISLDGQSAIRTPAWHLRLPGPASEPELYAKPDDRWEMNEVASRCTEIATGLVDTLTQSLEDLQADREDALLPLNDALVTPAE